MLLIRMNATAHLVVDWPLLLEELRVSGGRSFRELARATELSHVSLFNYANGVTSPSHATGERLIAYWCERTGKHRGELPMVQALKIVNSLPA